MIWMALSVGRPAARALLYPICAYYLIFSRHACRAIQPYLSRALGRPISRRDLYRQYHCFASTLLDRVYLLSRTKLATSTSIYGDSTCSRTAWLVAKDVSCSVRIWEASRSCVPSD